MTSGAIYLIPTELSPQSGLSTLSAEALDVIRGLDTFLVENIRTSRRFVSSLKLGLVIEDLDFKTLDKKTSSETIEEYLHMIINGKSVGIMSEAGSPGVADPGAAIVAKAHEQAIVVKPLVGPSSFLLTLMASGMNGQRFRFHGYLPIDQADRRKALSALEKDALKLGEAQMFMETPYRNNQLLADITNICRQNTRLCIAVNITAKDESINTLTIAEWKIMQPDLHKKPAV
ncbi:MAG: SAM-dependent methyltransferase, partial [Bacteroidota bacterium]